jgi:hypothetical protein
MPWEYWRWKIAEQFHWTLEQIDALSMADLEEYFQIQDGVHKASTSLLR